VNDRSRVTVCHSTEVLFNKHVVCVCVWPLDHARAASERATQAPESVVDKGAVHIDVEENRGNSTTFSTEIYAQPTNQFSNRHVLLDSCAGELAYKDRKLFYELVPAPKR
jgi:hypothetical protein